MIYHLTNRAAWLDAQRTGHYRAPSLATEGFIHCSTRAQILEVAKAFYRDQDDLLLLCIDERLLHSAVAWEAPAHPHPGEDAPRATDALFPHIYGMLNLAAIVAACDLVAGDYGFELPSGLP